MSEIVIQEVVAYWRGIMATLGRHGLLRERFPSGEVVVPEADGYVLPDRVVFVLHLQHLAGVPIDAWMDQGLWEDWRRTLSGRRVFVTRDEGLAVTVSRSASLPTSSLDVTDLSGSPPAGPLTDAL